MTDARVVIPVGDSPSFVAVSPDEDYIYVTNYLSNTVSVIDTSTRTVIRNPITFGYGPFGVAVTPDGGHLYVANLGSDMVSVIDTATNAVVATVQVGNSPAGVAVNPAGTRAYVTNVDSNTVSVIDTTPNIVIATVQNVGHFPWGVAVNPTGTRVYVTNLDLVQNDYVVSVIDTATNGVTRIQVGTATPPVGLNPFGVAVAPGGGHVYVTHAGSDEVSVIETATNMVIARIHVGPGPVGVAVAPGGGHVYVANTAELAQGSPNANTISVIDNTNYTVVTTLPPAGQRPAGVVATARNVYVAQFGSDVVSVIDV
jgi:YVTN family beta-propeller protein